MNVNSFFFAAPFLSSHPKAAAGDWPVWQFA
jgi:hypothetical protein